MMVFQGCLLPPDQPPWIHVNCLHTLGPLQLRTADVIENMSRILENRKIEISAAKFFRFLSHPMCIFSRIPYTMSGELDEMVKELVDKECAEWERLQNYS